MRNKVTNQPRVELDTVVVCNKDIISDAEKSCPTGEDPLAPKNECACLSACNVWCQGAYNIHLRRFYKHHRYKHELVFPLDLRNSTS